MKDTFLFILLSCSVWGLSSGCKTKKVVTGQKAKTEEAKPYLGANSWQGTKDSVDPKLGVIKTLD